MNAMIIMGSTAMVNGSTEKITFAKIEQILGGNKIKKNELLKL